MLAIDPKRAPTVRVVQGISDMPEHIVNYVAEQGAWDTNGAFDPVADTLYLIANNITRARGTRNVRLAVIRSATATRTGLAVSRNPYSTVGRDVGAQLEPPPSPPAPPPSATARHRTT